MTKRKLKTLKSQLAVTRKKLMIKWFSFEKKNFCYPDSWSLHVKGRRWTSITVWEILNSAIPGTLFKSNGDLIACKDKSKIVHHIEEFGSSHKDQSDESIKLNEYQSRVLIIDGMTVLNQIHKDLVMETWKGSIPPFWCNCLLAILKQSLERTD